MAGLVVLAVAGSAVGAYLGGWTSLAISELPTSREGHQGPAARASAGVPPMPAPTEDSQLAKARAILAPAAAPSRLRVPSIGVDAPVEAVGTDDQGRMAVPARATDVSWYKPGVAPGDAGNAVMAGHLDWTSGPAVFWRLGQLHAGNTATVIRADGSQVTFVVDSTTSMSFTAPTDSLFTSKGVPSLTLITCAGAWDQQRHTYLQRLVVHAVLS